ncbi:MAG: hypothetical protein Tsb0032_25280 [Kiloniellaceae bacterium]
MVTLLLKVPMPEQESPAPHFFNGLSVQRSGGMEFSYGLRRGSRRCFAARPDKRNPGTGAAAPAPRRRGVSVGSSRRREQLFCNGPEGALTL